MMNMQSVMERVELIFIQSQCSFTLVNQSSSLKEGGGGGGQRKEEGGEVPGRARSVAGGVGVGVGVGSGGGVEGMARGRPSSSGSS